MNLKQSLVLLSTALATKVSAQQSGLDYFDDDEWGLCFYDDQCLFSCGDAQSPEDCLQYQQGHPDAIPIDVPYFRGPGGVCEQTSKVPDKMGYCCTTCDESSDQYFCTKYWNNPDGCVQQGYQHFFNRVDAYYAEQEGPIDKSDFCYQVDVLGNRVATSSGDPHFKTWTGDKFDYHGECDLVLVDNPSFMDGLGLKLHIRTTRVQYYSYIERIALQIGDETLEFANDVETFLINGTQVEPNRRYHKTFFAGFLIRRDKKAISVRLSKENYKRGSPRIDFVQRKVGFPAVIINSEDTDIFRGSLGLLGDWATGKKMARDGKTELNNQEDATEFALEWQVRDTEPMLFQEARAPQFPTQCTPPAKILGNRLGSSVMRAQAEELCKKWGEDKEDCIFDVMATRDVEIAKEGAIKMA